MARIRTVKPDFWEDDAIGALSRDARLLFIATWNLADDEGLLRWSPAFLKAAVFMYDEDITSDAVSALMEELVDADLVFAYVAGKAKQRLAYVVNFRKHQRINRPQPSKLTPPGLQQAATYEMYIRRDKGVCHLCGNEVTRHHKEPRLWPSLDHVKPRSEGGSDYPSNIGLSHTSCNKARGPRPIPSFSGSPVSRTFPALMDSVNESVNDVVTHSPPEGNGMEGNGTAAAAAVPAGGRERRPQPPVNNHELPGQVAILRSKLNARRLHVRWDKLTDAELDEIASLVDTHGDAALVQAAVRSFQPNNPPVFAQAWLRDWRQMAPPGELREVRGRCPHHPLEPNQHDGDCRSCASERVAGER